MCIIIAIRDFSEKQTRKFSQLVQSGIVKNWNRYNPQNTKMKNYSIHISPVFTGYVLVSFAPRQVFQLHSWSQFGFLNRFPAFKPQFYNTAPCYFNRNSAASLIYDSFNFLLFTFIHFQNMWNEFFDHP